ncbi:MAG TPA: DHA2 family efflux MFS transporter permease subunit [Thermomicrobiaceae bacterium]|nr:DHA2 family efflux MFS transporter permease subunit [Thermomicrobiaceae bacterium]
MIVTMTGTRRWWALGAVTLAVLAVGLDSTVLSVALPTLATALHASESDLQWFTSGYLLVLAAAMLPAGLAGDRYGRKRVLLGSLALFGLGSAACAESPSSGAFLAARLGLGLAGAGVIVMAVSALTVLFSEEERPRAVGVWAAANFVALPVGPILGGWLLTHEWWGWVFLMNVPVALIGIVAVGALVPETRAARRPSLDPLGVLTSSAGLVGVTYGVIEVGQHGWSDRPALVAIVLGLLVLVGFFLWERRLTHRPNGQPLIDLALFQSRAFTWGVLLMTVAVLAMIGALFTMPQYFQGVRGTDAMGSGVRLLPLIVGLLVGAVPADRIAGRWGPRLTVAVGFAVLAAGLLAGGTTRANSSTTFVALWMAVVGAGMGLAMATAASAALSALSEERSGVGSAVLQALKNVGAPFGAALMGSALNSTYQSHVGPLVAGLPSAAAHAVAGSVFGGVAVAEQLHSAALLGGVRDAFVQGMDVALLVSAGVALAGTLLALAFLPRRAERGARVEPAAGERVESTHEAAV